MDTEKLFWDLYRAGTEGDVDRIISNQQAMSSQENWRPYGGSALENNVGVVQNQQSSPIAALIEKITNSIDAILMKRCYEENIDPRSSAAPKSIDEAVERFFPNNKNWDLSQHQYRQAENIQIIAHGPRKETSLVIYDNGEGQHPDNFSDTLLSLLRGNKNDIPFVQGKYNMGGSGAIIFCGRKRYQLIASKRFDRGPFGFTIVRKHPLTKLEEKKYKNTWYEYFVIENQIPRFDMQEIDLGLRGRQFTTGTLLKLYSYQLPSRSRSVISRDLNQSINEYLFEPALPIFTIDNNERYPRDINPERSLYGLKRRLEKDKDDSKYIYKSFSEEVSDWGGFKITCYVFKFKSDDKGSKETKETIRREFFKSNMSVLFSMNGQVHGHYTNEFISRSLKFNLLKEYLLIHIDCSKLETEFRDELFMASRDRMKDGEESSELRKKVADILKRSQLKEIYNEFKSKITSGDGDQNQILKDFGKNLPLNPDLTKLLQHTLNLDDIKKSKNKKSDKSKKRSSRKERSPFDGKRYPSSFSINTKATNGEFPVIQIPKGTESTIRFNTDVEDEYFDRIEEPGKLEMAVLGYKNSQNGGSVKPQPTDISELLSVAKSSPNNGTIRLHIKSKEEVEVGDSIKIQATLTDPVDGDRTQIFWVKILDTPNINEKPKKDHTEDIGLPSLHKVIESKSQDEPDSKTWEEIDGSGMSFNADTIVQLFVEGDKLEAVYINMDSNVLKKFIAKQDNEEKINLARNRYLSSVYFHTLFLYVISKNRKFSIGKEGENEVELQEYVADVFENYYAEFLLNFEISQLLDTLSD